MVFAYITESTADSGTAFQRVYTVNVGAKAYFLKEEIVSFLNSYSPHPELNLDLTTYGAFEKKNQEKKALTYYLKQNEEINFNRLKERRQSYGTEVDVLTGYDMNDFNNKLVEMMEEKGWVLTQYFKDGNLPTREWTFYKDDNLINADEDA